MRIYHYGQIVSGASVSSPLLAIEMPDICEIGDEEASLLHKHRPSFMYFRIQDGRWMGNKGERNMPPCFNATIDLRRKKRAEGR